MDGEHVDGDLHQSSERESMSQIGQAWAGIDAGKGHHHLVVIDQDGRRLTSQRVANDEVELRDAIDDTLALAEQVTWAIDLADGPAALAITLLLQAGQRVFFLPGIAVNRATAAYRGEGKTDAKDAAIIADQARMRRDLRELKLGDEAISELRMLTAHRADIAADRTRAINRLRNQLLSIFPALERELDFTNRGPLVLISGFQTPEALSALDRTELEAWLRARNVRYARKLATAALSAAAGQQVRLPGQAVAAEVVARLAATILRLNDELAEIDDMISARFRAHRHAPILTSIPGVGELLGAEFLAATGGSIEGFPSANHLAGYAGLAPAPRDSGRRTGNLHRPKRYNRQLQRVFYTSALPSIQRSPSSRAFYDPKRAEGKRHSQAVLALARRRVNVIWAMLRDERAYREQPSQRVLAA